MYSAAILAGGRATRFGGRDKSALVVDGRTIRDRQLEMLSSVAGDILIAGADESARDGGRRQRAPALEDLRQVAAIEGGDVDDHEHGGREVPGQQAGQADERLDGASRAADYDMVAPQRGLRHRYRPLPLQHTEVMGLKRDFPPGSA